MQPAFPWRLPQPVLPWRLAQCECSRTGCLVAASSTICSTLSSVVVFEQTAGTLMLAVPLVGELCVVVSHVSVRRCYLSSQQLLDKLNGGLVGLVVACFLVSKDSPCFKCTMLVASQAGRYSALQLVVLSAPFCVCFRRPHQHKPTSVTGALPRCQLAVSVEVSWQCSD